ncbi:MAG: hypothetical protein ACLQU1_12785 [Bryobacteraceae bacterium]
MEAGKSRQGQVSPPKIAEAIAGALLPPACRQAVLGSLQERHMHAAQYVADALCKLPLVVASQIRKNTEARIFLLEALTVFWSFTFAAFRPGQASFLDDPWVLLRIAIPATTTLLVLLLRNAYASPEDPVQYASILDVIIALACAFLSQPALSRFAPELALPRWFPTQGGIVGPWFLLFVRALFPPRARRPQDGAGLGQPASILELRWKAEEFGREVRRRNLAVYLTVAALAVFALRFVFTGLPRERAGCGLILAGVVYVVYQIRKRGLPGRVPAAASLDGYSDSYRRELERQVALLQRVSYWFYGALVPGFGLLILGTRIYNFIVILVILLIAELTHRAKQRLQREIDELTRPETLVARGLRSLAREAL